MRPGATPQDFHQDLYACERETQDAWRFSTSAWGNYVQDDAARARRNRCMQARGWELVRGEGFKP